jgi:hypothetical protein
MLLLFRRFFVVLCLGCALGFASPAADAKDLYFAGFSFAGDYDQNHERYPVAENYAHEMDAALQAQLKTLTRSDIHLKYSLGDMTSGDATAVAFALDQESHEDVPRGKQDLYIYRVIAEVLVFDFQSKTVLADFPAMVQYQDLDAPGRTDAEHAEVFKRIYLDPTFGANIFAEWVRRLDVAPIGKGYADYLAVHDVTLAPEVESMLREKAIDANTYRAEVAQEFEYSLASRENVALLPYTQGQAIGSKMAGRFANGESYTLDLPKPDFSIDIKVRPFQMRQAESGATDQYAFGAFITLTVEQPDLQKTYVSADFRNINTVVLDKSEAITPDLWQSYQTSLRALFNRLAEQISQRDATVLSDMTRTPDIDTQLRGFQEVLKKCM